MDFSSRRRVCINNCISQNTEKISYLTAHFSAMQRFELPGGAEHTYSVDIRSALSLCNFIVVCIGMNSPRLWYHIARKTEYVAHIVAFYMCKWPDYKQILSLSFQFYCTKCALLCCWISQFINLINKQLFRVINAYLLVCLQLHIPEGCFCSRTLF